MLAYLCLRETDLPNWLQVWKFFPYCLIYRQRNLLSLSLFLSIHWVIIVIKLVKWANDVRS